MRYAALLRGVNAGGNRRVPKAEFQAVLEDLGFYDVTIYINSGNAVFTSDNAVDPAVVQSALEKHFNFPIPTLILSGDKVREIASAIPSDWTNDTLRPDKSGSTYLGSRKFLQKFLNVNFPVARTPPSTQYHICP